MFFFKFNADFQLFTGFYRVLVIRIRKFFQKNSADFRFPLLRFRVLGTGPLLVHNGKNLLEKNKINYILAWLHSSSIAQKIKKSFKFIKTFFLMNYFFIFKINLKGLRVFTPSAQNVHIIKLNLKSY